MNGGREGSPALRLLIATSATDRRVCVLRGDRLCEFQLLPNDAPSPIGQIVLGRLVKIDRGLGAAFVDCSGGVPGFLALSEAPANATEGQLLILQVTREPTDGKQMRLTARPALAGYRLTYAPYAKSVAYADAIPDSEKQRLQRALESLGDLQRGMNPQRAALGASAKLLRAEAESLRAQWADIEQKVAAAERPQILQAAPDPLLEVLRHVGPSVNGIYADSRIAAAQAEAFCRILDPTLVKKVEFRPRRDWQPSVTDLEEQIDGALTSEIALPSGALLHVDPARAMTVIDVDSGQAQLEGVGAKAERSLLQVNLAAAEEIARQIRLRNIGGIIVVDFIDLRSGVLRKRVVDALRAAVAGDRHPVWVGAMSRLGLVELTRQRRGPTLAAQLMQECAACGARHRVPRTELLPWIGRGV
jgi:Rne/Rng family ribonuclease